MLMAEGKISPLPPSPTRFKTLRHLCSINGKQFEQHISERIFILAVFDFKKKSRIYSDWF